jgi:hypothetical protein
VLITVYTVLPGCLACSEARFSLWARATQPIEENEFLKDRFPDE